MVNSIPEKFLDYLCLFLPERRRGKRGPKPLSKNDLIREIYKLFKFNCGWRNIKYSSTCRNYLNEIQRRGLIKDFFNFLTIKLSEFRLSQITIDSSDIVSYRTNNLVFYSGKYHNYCIKFSIGVDKNCVPVIGRIDRGSENDSVILDKIVSNTGKLPYELFLDKGYERYQRRRNLKLLNCQVRMEMKKSVKNKKRGPKFVFNDGHKKERGLIEKVVAWLKSFMCLVLNRCRKIALISAMFYFCLSYVVFMRLIKL